MIAINWNPSRRELRQFAGIWLPAFVTLVAGIALWYGFASLWVVLPISAASLLFSAVAFIVPKFMRPVFVAWMCAAFPVGWTVSHVLLAMVYFGVMTPIAFAMRLVGYDPMKRRLNLTIESYWVAHTSIDDSARYFRQF